MAIITNVNNLRRPCYIKRNCSIRAQTIQHFFLSELETKSKWLQDICLKGFSVQHWWELQYLPSYTTPTEHPIQQTNQNLNHKQRHDLILITKRQKKRIFMSQVNYNNHFFATTNLIWDMYIHWYLIILIVTNRRLPYRVTGIRCC